MNKRLLVDEFTTPGPITVSGDTSVANVANLMSDHGIRHLPVVDDGKPVGLISDRDIKVLANFGDQASFRAQDIMSPEPFVVASDCPLEEVAMQMSEKKIGSAIVQDVEDGSLGIFTSTDALNALIEITRGLESGS